MVIEAAKQNRKKKHITVLGVEVTFISCGISKWMMFIGIHKYIYIYTYTYTYAYNKKKLTCLELFMTKQNNKCWSLTCYWSCYCSNRRKFSYDSIHCRWAQCSYCWTVVFFGTNLITITEIVSHNHDVSFSNLYDINHHLVVHIRPYTVVSTLRQFSRWQKTIILLYIYMVIIQ